MMKYQNWWLLKNSVQNLVFKPQDPAWKASTKVKIAHPELKLYSKYFAYL